MLNLFSIFSIPPVIMTPMLYSIIKSPSHQTSGPGARVLLYLLVRIGVRILTDRLGSNESVNERLMKGPRAPDFKQTSLAGAKSSKLAQKAQMATIRRFFSQRTNAVCLISSITIRV